MRAQGTRADGPDPAYVDPARRASLLGLLDDGFPGLSPRIGRAAEAGFVWEEVTQPFVAWEGDDAVGHVGVIEHRVVVGGEEALTAGVHAVVTRSDRRGRGVCRRLLAEALAWADARYPIAKLGTDLPAVYTPHGFRPLPLHAFGVDHAGGEDRGRPVTDPAAFLDLCARRAPVSHRFASLDPGWLVGIDLALQRRSVRDLVALDDLGAVVDWEVNDGTLQLHDLFAAEFPALDDLLALAPPHDRVVLSFCPDRLAPAARPIPLPDAGVWMVRGPWPEGDAPFGLSRLAEH